MYVVDFQSTDTKWCIELSNGFLMQGGEEYISHLAYKIDFLKPFANINYSLVCCFSDHNSDPYVPASSYATKTTTSFEMMNGLDGVFYATPQSWMAAGMKG